MACFYSTICPFWSPWSPYTFTVQKRVKPQTTLQSSIYTIRYPSIYLKSTATVRYVRPQCRFWYLFSAFLTNNSFKILFPYNGSINIYDLSTQMMTESFLECDLPLHPLPLIFIEPSQISLLTQSLYYHPIRQ